MVKKQRKAAAADSDRDSASHVLSDTLGKREKNKEQIRT